MYRNILDFATKQQNILSCRPHKILSALERCSRVPALSDSLDAAPNCYQLSYFATTQYSIHTTPYSILEISYTRLAEIF